jgi:hypothetical protein
MKADQIFQATVQVMKMLLTQEGVTAAIKRVRERDRMVNEAVLEKERLRINDLVRRLIEAEAPDELIQGEPQELVDAMVLRYLRNRDVFMQMFPDGIEGIDPDPVAIWASMMISPQDESEQAE